MESEAFAYLNILPDQLYGLTMREHANLLGGEKLRIENRRKEYADFVLMQLRGKSKKGSVSIEDILGKGKPEEKSQRRVTAEEKRSELDALEDILGNAVRISP